MIGLKNEFKSSSLEDWIVQLKKDLKGEDFSVLLRNDKIEEIEYATFQHQESAHFSPQAPGLFPFTRGLNTNSNNWSNGFIIQVISEKESNTKALEVLMKGCDLLVFDLTTKQDINFEVLFNGIQFEYIKTQIKLADSNQLNGLKAYFKNTIPATISFNQDSFDITDDSKLFSELVYELKENQRLKTENETLSKEPTNITLLGHTDSVWSLTVLQNGDLASGSGDNTIKI